MTSPRSIVIIVLLVAMNACAAPPRNDVQSIGIALDMLGEQGDSVALYRVSADGRLAFAGGYDARMRRFTWTDDLTHEEVEQLRAILRSPFWSQGRRDGGRLEEGEKRTTITIHQPLRGRIIVRGEQPEDVRAMESLLKSAASRRFEPELQALPRPGPQR